MLVLWQRRLRSSSVNRSTMPGYENSFSSVIENPGFEKKLVQQAPDYLIIAVSPKFQKGGSFPPFNPSQSTKR